MTEKTSNIQFPWGGLNDIADVPATFNIGDLFKNQIEIFIGRNPTNDIWLNHPAVSRTHASLRRETDGSLVVKDLGSTHGVTLDGVPVSNEATWKPLTSLGLGPQSLYLNNDQSITVVTRRGTPNLEAKDLTVIVPGRQKPILDHVTFTFTEAAGSTASGHQRRDQCSRICDARQ